MAVQSAAAWWSSSLIELQACRNVQDVGEIHVGAGEMWIAQFGDRLCDFREEMAGRWGMGGVMRGRC